MLTDTPHVHIHYWTSDEHLSKRGWGRAELVCHECNRARSVIFPDYNDAALPSDGQGIPRLRAERERFVREHSTCAGFYAWGAGRALCPPQYVVVDEVDLR